MKLSSILLRQHIGWNFSKHWVFQGKRKPIATQAEKVLKERNIQIYEAEDFTFEKKTYEKIDIVGFKQKPQALDETHPNWHDKILYSFKDNNVLLEGLNQAKLITNTIELEEGLPGKFKYNVPESVHKYVEKIILNSHVFDAEQLKIPKIKDPERPAWNFPRTYSITQKRRCTLLISKLLQMIESNNDQYLAQKRYLFNDLLFSYPFERQDQLVQFQLSGDFLLTSSSLLPPVTNASTESLNLPDIYPIEPIISLNKENIYTTANIYPIKNNISKSHPHTLFINYINEEVKNLFEEEVTETQILGRTLMKAFTVAASYAKQQYGDDIKLPKPVTIQCVQTDGQFFHFGVFQLNTLKLTDGSTKNIWYQTPLLLLFDSCQYELGKPILKGYNSEVINQLYGFYNQE